MHAREEEPLLPTRMGGQAKLRDYHKRWASRYVGCNVLGCVADHAGGDVDCIVESDIAVALVHPDPWRGTGGRRQSRRQLYAKTYSSPVKLPRVIGCGHKLEMLRQPRHRNCESCWMAFFYHQKDFAENIAHNITEQGPEVILYNYGRKFLQNFLWFAMLLAQYEHSRKLTADANNEQPEILG